MRNKTIGRAADVTTHGVNRSAAHLAPRNSRSKVARLKGLSYWSGELLVGVNSGQPETVSRSKVVARPSTMAFNEWRRSKGFQARTRRRKTLSAALGTGAGMHDEGVAHPEGVPIVWTFWDFVVLRMDSQDFRLGFANGTSGNIQSGFAKLSRKEEKKNEMAKTPLDIVENPSCTFGDRGPSCFPWSLASLHW